MTARSSVTATIAPTARASRGSTSSWARAGTRSSSGWRRRRAARTSASGSLPRPAAPAPEPALAPGESGLAAALDYASAFVAERLGETERALVLGDALARRRKFAPGLALAAAIARGDPTRPAGFARDAGRALVRAAVAADPTMARAWRTLASIETEAEHPRDAIEHTRRRRAWRRAGGRRSWRWPTPYARAGWSATPITPWIAPPPRRARSSRATPCPRRRGVAGAGRGAPRPARAGRAGRSAGALQSGRGRIGRVNRADARAWRSGGRGGGAATCGRHRSRARRSSHRSGRRPAGQGGRGGGGRGPGGAGGRGAARRRAARAAGRRARRPATVAAARPRRWRRRCAFRPAWPRSAGRRAPLGLALPLDGCRSTASR